MTDSTTKTAITQEAKASQKARARAMADVLRVHIKADYGSRQRIINALNGRGSALRYWLDGHPIPDEAFEVIAATLKKPPDTLRAEAEERLSRRPTSPPESVDKGIDGVSYGGPKTLESDGDRSGAKGPGKGAGLELRGSLAYRGYELWGREDPRQVSGFAAASTPGRRVLRAAGEPVGGVVGAGGGAPEHIFAVLVQDSSLSGLLTVGGSPVVAGHRLFFDAHRAAAAPIGSIVAAMTRTGMLAVGTLRPDPSPDGTGWTVGVGAHREPCIREDVLGEFVLAVRADPAIYEPDASEHPAGASTPVGPSFLTDRRTG